MTSKLEGKTGYVPVTGGSLYYEVYGQGPVVLLIHAGIADHRMWDEQLPALVPHYTVVRYDSRGFGHSKTEDVSFSNRQDVADVLDHLGIAQAAVVGVSRGGQIAIDFALEHPERVRALVPVCAGLGGYQQPDEAYSQAEHQIFDKIEAAETARDFPALTALEVRVWVDGPDQPEGRADAAVRQKVYDMVLNNYQTHEFFGQAQPLDPPAVDRLGEIRCPTLVISGDYDVSSCRSAAVVMAERIAGARHVAFPDAAHMPNMEQPERFNQVVSEFLASI